MKLLTIIVITFFVTPVQGIPSQNNSHGQPQKGNDSTNPQIGPQSIVNVDVKALCSWLVTTKLTRNIGLIYSPGYDTNSYLNNYRWCWEISASTTEFVKVFLYYIDIEQSQDCKSDSITVYEGNTLLGVYCGKTFPERTVRSNGNSVTIIFLTNSFVNSGKFFLGWEVTKRKRPSSPTCGLPNLSSSAPKIINGNSAGNSSWLWQVSIRYRTGHRCGGSIISPNVILTAAHCLYLDNAMIDKEYLSVAAGSKMLNGLSRIKNVSRYEIHPGYENNCHTSTEDIALLFLDGNLTYDKNIKPICLPTEEISATSICFATGWGRTENGTYPNFLMEVQLPIIPRSVCIQQSSWSFIVRDTHVCAGPGSGLHKGLCYGDSGGPLNCYDTYLSRWYISGVASWVAQGCTMMPSAFTNVVKRTEWIQERTNIVP